jgi:hypothetical protein
MKHQSKEISISHRYLFDFPKEKTSLKDAWYGGSSATIQNNIQASIS